MNTFRILDNSHVKKFFAIVVPVVVFFLMGYASTNMVSAQEEEDCLIWGIWCRHREENKNKCSVDGWLSRVLDGDFTIGRQKTLAHYALQGSSSTLCYMLGGTKCENLAGCSIFYKEQFIDEWSAGGEDYNRIIPIDEFLANIEETTPEECEDVEINAALVSKCAGAIDPWGIDDETPDDPADWGVTGVIKERNYDHIDDWSKPLSAYPIRGEAVQGSLAGLSVAASGTVEVPPPVNMAYFFEKQAEKLPGYGTAYAQTSSIRYETWFINEAFRFWVIFRNMALLGLSAITMIVGLMIMFRKRLSNQTAITIQYAIPRIVISIILILFSYPLGALFTSLTWGLAHGNAFGGFLGSMVDNVLPPQSYMQRMGPMPLLIVSSVVAWVGGGIFSMVLLPLLWGATLVMYMSAVFTRLFVLYRMTLEIVVSPVLFLAGAIPGNENIITDYFKRLFVHAISVIGIGLGLRLIWWFAVSLSFNSATWYTGVFTALVTPILTPAILLFSYRQLTKLPKRLRQAILNER